MIEANAITFGYRRGRPVIQDWNASFALGQCVAITGPSGAGKSTLLYVLGTLVQPWRGTLRIAGKLVDSMSDEARARLRGSLIGFVFQDAILDPRRSILDNVIEGAVYRAADRRAAMLRAVDLLEEMSVDVEPTRSATDISGGQAQRVALCRALLADPPIILADEPTGNLDPANARVVQDVLLGRAHDGGCVVIVTHDAALAARCDRVIRL